MKSIIRKLSVFFVIVCVFFNCCFPLMTKAAYLPGDVGVTPGSVMPTNYVNVNIGEFLSHVWDTEIYAGRSFVGTVANLFDDDICPIAYADAINGGRHHFVRGYTQVDGKQGYFSYCEYCGASAGDLIQENIEEKMSTDGISQVGSVSTTLKPIGYAIADTRGSAVMYTPTSGSGSSGVNITDNGAIYGKGDNPFKVIAAVFDTSLIPITTVNYSFNVYCGVYRVSASNIASLEDFLTKQSTQPRSILSKEKSGTFSSSGVNCTVPFISSPVQAAWYYYANYYDGTSSINDRAINHCLLSISYNAETAQAIYNSYEDYMSYNFNAPIAGYVDNSYIYRGGSESIVNTDNSTYYNPTNNTTYNVSDYNYDFSDNSVTLTVPDFDGDSVADETATTVDIVYGDAGITITENTGDTSTVYNYYYMSDIDTYLSPADGVDEDPEATPPVSDTPESSPSPTATPDDPLPEVTVGIPFVVNEPGAIVTTHEDIPEGIYTLRERLSSMFTVFPDMVGDVGSFLNDAFDYVPSEIRWVLGFGMTCAVFVGIFKLFFR